MIKYYVLPPNKLDVNYTWELPYLTIMIMT